jgi:hypothetical protein
VVGLAGPRHARPQAGAARGSGPAASGGFDTTRVRRRNTASSGRRNGRVNRTKEQSRTHRARRRHHPSLTIGHPMVGDRLNTPHTQKFGHSQDEAIIERRTRLRKLQLEAEQKHFPEGFEPDRKIVALATEETRTYTNRPNP